MLHRADARSLWPAARARRQVGRPETKWDGCRLQVRFNGKRLFLRTRPGRDCTAEFPKLHPLAEALARRRVILDGELVCLDSDGRPDFGQLRSRLGRRIPGKGAAMLMVFDVLDVCSALLQPPGGTTGHFIRREVNNWRGRTAGWRIP